MLADRATCLRHEHHDSGWLQDSAHDLVKRRANQRECPTHFEEKLARTCALEACGFGMTRASSARHRHWLLRAKALSCSKPL